MTPAGKIAPGASKTFSVTYVMSSLGIKNATVNIYSNIDSGSVCLIQQTYTFAVKANQISLAPVITTFSPQSGPAGTTVTITGSGFNTTASNNIVFFGAALASVSASTDTSLTVTTPAGANFQYISVTNLASNLTGYSSMPFLETFPGGCKTEFAARVNFSTGSTPYSVSIGDLDGDGKPDLAVANYGSNTVSVFRNTSTTGGVSFAAKVDFGTGSSPKSVSIGDIDGDGKPDLAVTNSGASNSVSVFRNTSTTGGVSFAAKVDFGTGSSPWSVSMGDLNGDGKTDLAVANRTGFSVSVLRNTSTSGGVSFAAKVDFSAGSSPYSISIGDLDGDGKPDLAVANNGDNTASVYQNTSISGGVSFAAKVDYSAGSGPVSISIGDIDGDGKPDLAVANNSGNNASVFLNTSTTGIIDAGSFAARVDFAAGGAPQIVSIGDIDGNGKPDLAVANFTSNSVSVLRNTSVTGTVSFAAKVDLGSAGQASSVSIGDIDGDGKPEIASTNYNVNSVSVFRNIALPAAIQTAASGNGNPITNGSVIPSLANLTDFGNVSTGGNLNRTYTFQNTSTDSLSVDSIKITGTDSVLFTAGSLTPAGKIASGGSKTFNVTFSPNSSGLKNATVIVYSNINSGTVCLLQQTYTFAISGTGFASVQTNALNFDGTNDHVALPNALTTSFASASTTQFTIEYWFKGTSLQSAVRFQNGSGYIVAGWNGTHIISTDGNTAAGISVGAGATDGNWHHIAVTWKKNTVNGFRSYLDGALVAQRNSANVNLPVITTGGYLGAYNLSTEWMNGTLDEVRIWNRELSQSEISTNRFLQINSGTGLLASYHFNQGIAGGNNTGITTLTDATSNNYTGTLGNFTLNGPASNFVGSGPGLIPASSAINITFIPEGLYDAGTDRLRLRDTARAYLHSNISPFGVVDSAVAVIDSVTFTGSFIFANAAGGTYYIRVNHRNCIETWSRTRRRTVCAGNNDEL
ncbi:MAG: VCBS repeat-containing protein [Ignavibacteria bacterium]|nr:VCBS repeat-containing protein [Ignavibacteria bacterium]